MNRKCILFCRSHSGSASEQWRINTRKITSRLRTKSVRWIAPTNQKSASNSSSFKHIVSCVCASS